MATIAELNIERYKSFREIAIPLGSLNVTIGPNGAGKSNLVSFFRLLRDLGKDKLQEHVAVEGRAHSLLFHGPKESAAIDIKLTIEAATSSGDVSCVYHARLVDAAVDTLIFGEETVLFSPRDGSPFETKLLGSGHRETALRKSFEEGGLGALVVFPLVTECQTYQFDDTSSTAGIRRPIYLQDSRSLRSDGANLAAVLHRLRNERTEYYRRILETIRQIAPFFDDFVLQPGATGTDVVLNWRQKESDYLLGPHQLSDGTLRAMALVTLLLQPEDEMPQLAVIDEPELGLHPFAIGVLGSLLKQASHHCQIIVATQSAALLNEVEVEDVVVVERGNRESTMRRLDADELRDWLEQYSLRDLWERNIIGGGPA